MKKDIEWLKREIGNMPYTRLKRVGMEDYVTISKRGVLELIDQLDEPETLSQKWMDEHVVYGDVRGGTQAFIKVDDLQNLLVPKQGKVEEGRVRLIVGFDGGTESYYATDIGDALDFLTDYDARFTVSKEPVIPNYVAKWISEHHERFDLYPALRRLEQLSTRDRDVYKWYRENTPTFVSAYLTGDYEVEEEQKYYVLTSSNKILLIKDDGEVRETYQAYSWIMKRDKERYQLTEQEIKDYDPRYMTFAKPVEELEE